LAGGTGPGNFGKSWLQRRAGRCIFSGESEQNNTTLFFQNGSGVLWSGFTLVITNQFALSTITPMSACVLLAVGTNKNNSFLHIIIPPSKSNLSILPPHLKIPDAFSWMA